MTHAAERHVRHYTTLETPIGRLIIGGDRAIVLLIGFPEGRRAVTPWPDWHYDSDLYSGAREQLSAWFAGDRTGFDFPMRMIGTPGQIRVWQALRTIPYGETVSYADLARMVDPPSGPRAVGTANGANPLPVTVPCHRVIGSDGSLTGYGGGLSTKRWLLDHERAGWP